MDVAKLNGLIVDKAEVRTTRNAVSAEPMTEAEWVAKYCKGEADA